jgi:hypothetical protein
MDCEGDIRMRMVWSVILLGAGAGCTAFPEKIQVQALLCFQVLLHWLTSAEYLFYLRFVGVMAVLVAVLALFVIGRQFSSNQLKRIRQGNYSVQMRSAGSVRGTVSKILQEQ